MYVAFIGKIALAHILLCGIAGCSLNPNQPSASNSGGRLTQPYIAREDSPQVNQEVETDDERLASGEATVIQTSNGEIVVEPTVVATTDESTGGEHTAGSEYYDPLEKFNRAVFGFNNFTYRYALIPASKGYNFVAPKVVQSKVTNVFENIGEPLNLINNLATLDGKDAGKNIGRFLINSTIGILGIFDPATHWFNIEEANQSFGETLSRYNISSGAYLVLPILGQSDLRNATSVTTEALLNPVSLTVSSPESSYILGAGTFNGFASQAEIYEKLYEQAEDPYIYFRNQYIQSRNRDDLAEAELEGNPN